MKYSESIFKIKKDTDHYTDIGHPIIKIFKNDDK